MVDLVKVAQASLDLGGKPVPPFYLPLLASHLESNPHDTNFIVELRGSSGYGIVTCMDEYCWMDIALEPDPARPDGGRSDGFGSFHKYQEHCTMPGHVKGRQERLIKAGIPSGQPPASVPESWQFASTRVPLSSPGPHVKSERDLLSELDEISPPKHHIPLPSTTKHHHNAFTREPLSWPSSSTQAARSAAGLSSKIQTSPKHVLNQHDVNLPDTKPSSTQLVSSQGKGKAPLGRYSSAENPIVLTSDSEDDDEVKILGEDQVPTQLKRVTNKGNPFILSDDEDEEQEAVSKAVGGPSQSTAKPSWGALESMRPKTKEEKAAERKRREAERESRKQELAERVKKERDEAMRRIIDDMRPKNDLHIKRTFIAKNEKQTLLRAHTRAYNKRPLDPTVPQLIITRIRMLNEIIASGGTLAYPTPQPELLAKVPALYAHSTAWDPPLAAAQPAGNDENRLLAHRQANAVAGSSSRADILPKIEMPGSFPAISATGETPLAALIRSANPYGPGLPADEDADYGTGYEWDRPLTSEGLTEFFSSALDSFSEDNDVDKALVKLGLASLNDRMPGLSIQLMPHQVLGVAFMLTQEGNAKFRGGLLGDQMGLGKTVQTIACIVKGQNNPDVDPKIKTTLIVAPLSLLIQWKAEIESKAPKLTVTIHHGGKRTTSPNQLRKYHVVLTTYGCLVSESGKEAKKNKKKKRSRSGSLDSFISDDEEEVVTRKKGPLFRTRFLRIVLDEAHYVRNRNTRAAKTIMDLDAIYRWGLSGSFIVNGLDDIFPMLSFTGISPSRTWEHFRDHISKCQKRRPKLAAKRMQAILKTCMIRRHKESELNGKRLLELPPKTTTLETLDFTQEERQLYDMLEQRARVQINKYLKKGTVLKNMAHALVLLLRLRQVTCHPWLLRRRPGEPVHPNDLLLDDDEINADIAEEREDDLAELTRARTLLGQDWVDQIKAKLEARELSIVKAERNGDEEAGREGECAICFDQMLDERITSCQHGFCQGCLDEWFTAPARDTDLTDHEINNGMRKCPLCRTVIQRAKTFRASAFIEKEPEEAVKAEEDDDDWGSQAEEDELVEEDNVKMEPGADRKGKRRASEMVDKKPKKKAKGKDKAKKEEEEANLEDLMPSTKMNHMGRLVDHYLSEDPTNKIIIFSQFVSFIDLVSAYFNKKGIPALEYVGAMSQDQRDATVKTFTAPIENERSPRILIISLKCGGVGLNLVAACKCICMDLAWNMATEDQATSRTHRIGQTKPVDIRRLVISGTVEQRILELQEKKQALSDGALGEGQGGRLGRLTVRELVGLFGIAHGGEEE